MTNTLYIQKISVFLCALFLSMSPLSVSAESFDETDEGIDVSFFVLGLGSELTSFLFEDATVDPQYHRLPQSLKENVASLEQEKSKKPLSKKISTKNIAPRVTRMAKTQAVVATAYSSTSDQTDSSPCITANGFNVCKNNVENVIAANFLPFGTRVRLPDLYGDRVFTVHDRMNARYRQGRIDLWMKTRTSAKQFGVKRTVLEVVSDDLATAL